MPLSTSVAVLSKSDESGGGASKVACQLRDLLLTRHGHQYAVDHWTANRSATPSLLNLQGGVFGQILYRASKKISRAVGLPDFLTTELITLTTKKRMFYDLYHIHDISDAISPYTLNVISKGSPVIWTFHDCSPFTGGCIYPMGCAAYVGTSCRNCPQLGNWPLMTHVDRTTYMQTYKVSLINRSFDAVVCPSKWIADQACLAGIKGSLIRVIPNAVDTETFRPQPKMALRHNLSLPPEGDIVLLSTMDFQNPYKGTAFAGEALSRIERPAHVMLIGLNPGLVELPKGHHYIYRNRTFNKNLLAKYYAACDVLLFPSMADNCPLALLEAMACGTPAVAFDSGGIGEIISHQQDGWLAKRGDVDALTRGLRVALSEKATRLSWLKNARKKILKRYNEDTFVKSHIDIYEELLNRAHRDRS